MFKYSACSESFLDSFDIVVLYLRAERVQVKVNTTYKAMGHNLCFKRNIRLVHCLLV